MYLAFYGLDALPFELSPDPRYLLLTESHREALANLQYGISARKSLTLITGEAGTGKTTLINAALSSVSCRDVRIVHLSNSMLSRQEFVEFLAASFMLSPEAARSKARLLSELERELLQRRAQGVTTALVIDEAQCLERELLEEIRLLSNIETPTEKLLPLVLVGQPEFAERLNLPSLRQLKQRVALRCELSMLTANETAAYIAGRMRIAGGDASTVFSSAAIAEVHRFSAGIPRTISVICDNALVNGFAAGIRPITPELVHDVCADFDLSRTRSDAVAREHVVPAIDAPIQAARQADAGRPLAQEAIPEAQPMFGTFSRKRRFSFF